MITIAPCPFCNGEGLLTQSPVFKREWRVSCKGCFAAGGPDLVPDEAAKNWNSHITRVPAGEIAYALTQRLVIDMPTARAAVDEALSRYTRRPTNGDGHE